MRRGLTAACALIAVTMATGPARGDAFDDCSRGRDLELRLRDCSEVISGEGYSSHQKAVAHRIRGRARVEAGALDAAIADLDEAIRLDPADGYAWVYRALARSRRGDLEGAMADYTEATGFRQTSAIGYNGRGHAHLVRGDARSAIADFTEAITLNPGSAIAHNNRGLAHRMAGDTARAVEDYTTAIGLNPIYALAYANRGFAHETAGRRSEAVADYGRALLVDPTLAGAREGLARLGDAGPAVGESEKLVLEGRGLVQKHCAGCHAIGSSGQSPLAKAPPFHALHARHPMQGLREPLTRGIAAPHDEMPRFRLPDSDIDKVVAYINSLGARP